MKKLVAIVFTQSYVLSGACLSMAGETDLKGSRDLTLRSRMPGFHITGYSYTDFASHRFNDQTTKHVMVQGSK